MPINNEEYSKYLNMLLKDFLSIIRDYWKDNLTSVVLYGISKKDVSHLQSDIDLLIICKQLPQSKWERYDLIMKLLAALEPKAEQLYNEIGIHVYISPILKSQKEAEQINKSYFDLVKEGRVLFDRNNFFQKIIKSIETISKKLPL
ncbi:MAG: hypothetical protein A2Y62_21280 [Candidatus Fischerbacteria bacterium RBG_13_37_8]|uniref:Polymerase beta nucleotidyltransferase domain-containing protein n=1 Tax=Candidatus Fischerbacteria bacterium RBG_13_37_8 TaxID=1817863 RepID=A0A1F5VP23_9BACT|nr:MAG: hypothetical protein A2Y62_21280 [Candidatus Fischerbacteria bacterium RBG_13_37_8]